MASETPLTCDKAVIKLPFPELFPAATPSLRAPATVGLGLGSDRFRAAAVAASGARLEATTGPADEAPGVTAATELLEEFEEVVCPSSDEERRDKLRLLPTTGRISGAKNGRSVRYCTPGRGRRAC